MPRRTLRPLKELNPFEKPAKVECDACWEEFSSPACLRIAHQQPWLTKEGRMEAAHKAFGKWIEKHYGSFRCFDENTLDRDENGNYTNMSVMMDWDDWFDGWRSALKFVKIIK